MLARRGFVLEGRRCVLARRGFVLEGRRCVLARWECVLARWECVLARRECVLERWGCVLERWADWRCARSVHPTPHLTSPLRGGRDGIFLGRCWCVSAARTDAGGCVGSCLRRNDGEGRRGDGRGSRATGEGAGMTGEGWG